MDAAKLERQKAELAFKQQKAQMDGHIEMMKLRLEMHKMGMEAEAKEMTERGKIIVAQMDIEAAKANRRAQEN